MKKFRTVFALMLALVMAMAFAACSGNTVKDYDVKSVAKSIIEGCTFEDQYMEEIPTPEFTLEGIYNVDPALIAEKDGAKEAAVYVASAGPEAVICIKAVDADAANTIMDHIQNRILEDAEAYKNYGPEKVPYLQTAVKIVKGVYVFVAVTADNTAASSVINGLLK